MFRLLFALSLAVVCVVGCEPASGCDDVYADAGTVFSFSQPVVQQYAVPVVQQQYFAAAPVVQRQFVSSYSSPFVQRQVVRSYASPFRQRFVQQQRVYAQPFVERQRIYTRAPGFTLGIFN